MRQENGKTLSTATMLATVVLLFGASVCWGIDAVAEEAETRAALILDYTPGAVGDRVPDHRRLDAPTAGITGQSAGLDYLPTGSVRDGIRIDFGTGYIPAYKGLKVAAATGTKSLVQSQGSTMKPLLRMGAAYDIEVNAIRVKPSINMDVVGGKRSTIFGLGFSRKF